MMKALQCVELGGPDKLEINEVDSPSAVPGSCCNRCKVWQH